MGALDAKPINKYTMAVRGGSTDLLGGSLRDPFDGGPGTSFPDAAMRSEGRDRPMEDRSLPGMMRPNDDRAADSREPLPSQDSPKTVNNAVRNHT
jgi:hypothetical protein